jgi:hypothetical protein
MPTYVNVSGTWQELTGTDRPFAKVGGVWQGATNMYAKVGGVWQQVYQYDNTGPTVPTPTVVQATSGTSSTVSWTAITDSASGVASATLYQDFIGSTSGIVAGSTYSIPSGAFSGGSTSMNIPTNRRLQPSGETWQVAYRIIATDNAGNSTTGLSSIYAYNKPFGNFFAVPDIAGLGNNAADARNLANTAWLNQTAADEGVVGISGTKAYGAWFYNNNTFSNICLGFAPDSGSIWLQRAGAAQTNRGNSGDFTIQGHTSPTKSGALTFVSTTITQSISGNDGVGNPSLSAGMLSALGTGTIQGFGLSSFYSGLGNIGFLRGLTVSTNNNPFGIYSGTVFLSFT